MKQCFSKFESMAVISMEFELEKRGGGGWHIKLSKLHMHFSEKKALVDGNKILYI